MSESGTMRRIAHLPKCYEGATAPDFFLDDGGQNENFKTAFEAMFKAAETLEPELLCDHVGFKISSLSLELLALGS